MISTFKDPVCGMTVLPGKGDMTFYDAQIIYFCSTSCCGKFLERPEQYLRPRSEPSNAQSDDLGAVLTRVGERS